jgi:DNA invertase Pin-like site-specific DNA recombinase
MFQKQVITKHEKQSQKCNVLNAKYYENLGGIMKQVRCALYARVSTNGIRQDPEMQLAELRELCKARGWTIVAEYVDFMSGAKESRPQLNQMTIDARAGKFNCVLVWKLDRYARSLRHLVNALAEYQSMNIAFVSLKDSLDLSTANGRLMFGIIAAMAEFERELIRERIMASIKKARAEKKVLGRPKLTNPEKMSRTTLWRRAKGANVANATA